MAENNIKTYRNPDDPITLEELKSFLWAAATHLRGQIDAAGYKEYIFPLLFFKRISDVYDEQFEGFLSEGGEEYAGMQAEELPIRIPEGAHWRDVRQVTENVGQRLVEAFIAIEQANPAKEMDGRKIGGLEGIFGPKDGWTNKAKMPDSIITSLIEDFSKYTLSFKACPADEMGQAYEYLVGKFADDAGNTAQEFYTNRTVVQLMAEILQPQPNESIYDPTCGTGGMLVKCLDYLRNKGEEWQGVQVFGQEVNGLTSSIARMNLYLNSVEDFSIACADTLENPAFLDGSHLRKFDIVLANPPYSIKEWNRDKFMNDKWGRNFLGTPPQGNADYAFIQHIIASMNSEKGRCAILLPHGVLNRNAESELRKELVRMDIIDTIIGLGRQLFFNSGLESCILICNRNKNNSRKGKILFIEAEKLTHKTGTFTYLSKEDQNAILEAYHQNSNIEGLSNSVRNEDVIAQNGNLNIKTYVKCTTSNNVIGKLSLDTINLHLDIVDLLSHIGVDVNNEIVPTQFNINLSCDKTSWKKVKLGDVASEYSVRCDMPSESEYDDFVGSNCIDQYDFNVGRTSDAKQVNSAQKLFKKGDYLLVRRSLYGSDFRERAPRATFDGVCSADILTIRENNEVIADGFLIYVLYQKELWDFIVANSTGSLTRRIKWNQLKDYEFDLPPLEEQKVLADKLWAAYRLKEGYKKLLAATDEMVKSQFIEMYRRSHKEMTLESICTYMGKGVTPKYVASSSVIVINQACVHWNGQHLENVKYHNENVPVKKRILETGDVLLNATGNGTLGRCCVFNCPSDENQYVNDGHVIAFSTDRSVILPEVLNSYLSLSDTQSEIYRQYVTGSTNQIDIVFTDIKNMTVPVPNMREQLQFVSILQQADKSKFELRKSIDAIDKVIKSLINN